MRTLYVEIEVDEDVLLKYPGDETVSRVEAEIGKLTPEGIRPVFCKIADADDEVAYARYLNYLVDWAFAQDDCSERRPSPMTFENWLNLGR